MIKTKKSLSLTALAAAGILLFAGCASDDKANDTIPSADIETSDSSAPETEPEETPEVEEPAVEGDLAFWAAGSTDIGEEVGSATTDSWKITVYQVATGEMSKDSMFVDPDTNKNLLPKGSEIVFYNFVFQNISDENINLGSSLGSASIRTASWRYMTGMPGESSSAVYDELGLSSTGNDPSKLSEVRVGDTFIFPVAPGEKFTSSTSIEYEPGVEAEADISLIPVDSEGKLIHDEKEAVKIDFTVK